MSDDKSKRGPQDSSKVNVHEDYEVEYWCRKFGCTRTQLVAAVAAVGTSTAAVEKYLKGK
jgi:hypothetical protein